MASNNFNLDEYETVESRLRRLYEKYPQARLLTEIVYQDDRRFVCRTELYLDIDDPRPITTGHAEEIVGAGFVNKTSALENCETSSIGRCLSNSILMLGAPVGKRPSAEEMQKVQRYKDEPRKAPARKVTYTEAQVQQAQVVYDTISAVKDKEALRELWTANQEILELPINGTTLKDTFNKRVAEITA